MPSEPAFDYYDELGLEPGSSIDEVRIAYRRLALVRHPDRNPNDATATASFQRLHEAYETLSDPDKKMQYDTCHVRAGAASGTGGASAFDASDEDEYAKEILKAFYHMYRGRPDPTLFSTFMSWFDRRFNPNHRSFDTTSAVEEFTRAVAEIGRAYAQAAEVRRRDMEDREASHRHPAQVNEARLKKERQANEARLKKEREAEERQAAAQKEAEERQATAQKEADDERAEQETRWIRFRATTAGDKRDACLHSQYDGWAKTVHQRKPKCDLCRVKRSMATFTCPYCEIMVCPKCRDELVKQKREVAEKH